MKVDLRIISVWDTGKIEKDKRQKGVAYDLNKRIAKNKKNITEEFWESL